MQAANIGVLAVLGVILACGGGRPEGELQTGEVAITASATADGIPLGSAGITAAAEIVVTGAFTDRFGVETSSYSWNDGPLLPLALGADGEFELTLTLVNDENVLHLEGGSIIGDAITALDLPYTKDGEAPTIVIPSEEFAAVMVSEGTMDIDKEATSFSLSGGTSVAVRDNVAFSKYSTTYGIDQPNRPMWRFRLLDNHDLVDGRMEFRLSREGEDELLVDWTSAPQGEDAYFEATVSSTLNARIGEESGAYLIEVRGYDSAGNSSPVTVLHWNQTILPPPIYIAAGSVSSLPLDADHNPSTFVMGDNFGFGSSRPGVVVGAMRIGNPNSVAVLLQLKLDLLTQASYTFDRRIFTVAENIPAPPGVLKCAGLGWKSGQGCVASPSDLWTDQHVDRRPDDLNINLGWRVRTVGGELLSDDEGQPQWTINNGDKLTLLLPANTEVFAEGYLEEKIGNLGTDANLLDDQALLNYPDQTIQEIMIGIFKCVVPAGLGCLEWKLRIDAYDFLQAYVTWDFTIEAMSKVNLDTSTATPWGPAHPGVVDGYSRVLAVGHQLDALYPVPTSHDDFYDEP